MPVQEWTRTQSFEAITYDGTPESAAAIKERFDVRVTNFDLGLVFFRRPGDTRCRWATPARLAAEGWSLTTDIATDPYEDEERAG